MSTPLLQIRDLAVSFAGEGSRRVQAVDGVRLTVHPRQTVALVGESGCGKSVTAMSVLHLIPRPPGRFDGGQILFQTPSGQRDLLAMSEKEMRSLRGNDIAMIFQEPMTSLNPVYTIGEQIIEAVRLHQDADKEKARAIAVAAMHAVGIKNPESRLNAYPHQFSGGMRQRVMIAMALACKPRLLIADEPTTALDVTIQAQILELLRGLQRGDNGMSIMLITHALGVVAENADVVCVMYAGRVVEYATVLDLFDRPLHPYTRGLLASIPKTRDRAARLTTIRQIVDDDRQFAPIDGAWGRPWWPTHTAGSATYDLMEVTPNHWVGIWTEPGAKPSRFPDLPFRMPTNSGAFQTTQA